MKVFKLLLRREIPHVVFQRNLLCCVISDDTLSVVLLLLDQMESAMWGREAPIRSSSPSVSEGRTLYHHSASPGGGGFFSASSSSASYGTVPTWSHPLLPVSSGRRYHGPQTVPFYPRHNGAPGAASSSSRHGGGGASDGGSRSNNKSRGSNNKVNAGTWRLVLVDVVLGVCGYVYFTFPLYMLMMFSPHD